MKNNVYQKDLVKLTKKMIYFTPMRLMNFLDKEISRMEGMKQPIKTKHFLISEGQIPFTLIAHLDTVWDAPPDPLYIDKKHDILFAPQCGVGADDRAGVAAIMYLLYQGYRPNVIFTTGEENGGIGASMLVRTFNTCPFDTRCLVELDREGSDDCVFYSCGNDKFISKIESYGFDLNVGTFSDIAILGPTWDVATVNLSIGFYNEHTYAEYLDLNDTRQTIIKLKKMMQEVSSWDYYDYQYEPPKFNKKNNPFSLNELDKAYGYNDYYYNDWFKEETYV